VRVGYFPQGSISPTVSGGDVGLSGQCFQLAPSLYVQVICAQSEAGTFDSDYSANLYSDASCSIGYISTLSGGVSSKFLPFRNSIGVLDTFNGRLLVTCDASPFVNIDSIYGDYLSQVSVGVVTVYEGESCQSDAQTMSFISGECMSLPNGFSTIVSCDATTIYNFQDPSTNWVIQTFLDSECRYPAPSGYQSNSGLSCRSTYIARQDEYSEAEYFFYSFTIDCANADYLMRGSNVEVFSSSAISSYQSWMTFLLINVLLCVVSLFL